jgi:RNA polymerase sigma-70 factor (ECF subfamily)
VLVDGPNFRSSPEQASLARARKMDEELLRQLMVRYQQADAEAVDELVRQLSPLLLRFLAGTQLKVDEAEDLLQECWMRIHRSRHTYRPTEPLLPWIFAIARHTRLDAYRKRRRLAAKESLVADVPVNYSSSNDSHHVLSLLDRLPVSQRDVLVMMKVVGMTLEEIAAATASTTGAVKQKAHRAYEGLRRMLEEKSK